LKRPRFSGLRLAAACALTASLPALAFDSFVIKDIRVEGVQRTEAGTVFSGSIKSAVGIGTLLAEGIGDTIRVSLTVPNERNEPAAPSHANDVIVEDSSLMTNTKRPFGWNARCRGPEPGVTAADGGSLGVRLPDA